MCIEYHVDHLSTVSFRTRQWILRRFLEKDRAFIVTIHCRHWFLCLGYIGAAVHRRRLVFICAIVNTFFVVVKCALYLAFFSFAAFIGCVVPSFFSTRDFKWPALSEMNRANFYQ